MSYFVRRILFVVALFLFEASVWPQIAIMMLSTMVMLVIYLHFKPLEDPKAQKIEILNELTMLATLYILVFFTDLTDAEDEFRSNLGLLSILITFSNLAVHVTLLLIHSCKSFKRFI